MVFSLTSFYFEDSYIIITVMRFHTCVAIALTEQPRISRNGELLKFVFAVYFDINLILTTISKQISTMFTS